MVSAFMTAVSHMIKDHKEATGNRQGDIYYIEKLNATLLEHKGMSQHIQTLATQDAVLSRHMRGTLLPNTYDAHLHELSEYATTVDQ